MTIFGTELADVIIGTTGGDIIDGLGGNDVIDGLAGDDEIAGGDGDDTLVGGGGNDSLYGGAGADTLTATGSGNLTLDGGTGVDTMDASGATGYVNFYVDETDDVVITGSGTNYLYVAAAYYEAPDGIFDIRFNDASLAQTVVGTDDINHFRYMYANDTAVGGGGNDYYYLYDGRATIVEEDGGGYDRVQILTGSYDHTMADWVEEGTMFGSNTLYGNALDNVLAGQGTTTLAGGLGNDTYRIWNTTTIIEAADEGTDTVEVYFSYTLADNFENLTYREYRFSSGHTLTGNSVANVITGYNGNEVLYGLDGDDTLIGDVEGGSFNASYHSNDRLYGGDGADTLYGVYGNDTLEGGAGADVMVGGVGDDSYVVDDTGDAVTENADEGIDTVTSSISYALADNVENLVLSAGQIDGSGNRGDNTITGTDLANVLAGNGGNDVLYAGAGADRLYGGRGIDHLYGEGGADLLNGGKDDDVFHGGGGTDKMIGGLGADTFAYASLDDAGPSRSASDIIADFDHAEGDVIDLSAIDADSTTAGSQAFTFIGEAAFSGTAGELRYVRGASRTTIEMDVDGDGQADAFLRLNGRIDLVEGDFLLGGNAAATPQFDIFTKLDLAPLAGGDMTVLY